jgi:hypothetical protein
MDQHFTPFPMTLIRARFCRDGRRAVETADLPFGALTCNCQWTLPSPHDHRCRRTLWASASMSKDERASSISADYLLPFAFARAHFCPDIRKILENSVVAAAIRPAHLRGDGGAGPGCGGIGRICGVHVVVTKSASLSQSVRCCRRSKHILAIFDRQRNAPERAIQRTCSGP